MLQPIYRHKEAELRSLRRGRLATAFACDCETDQRMAQSWRHVSLGESTKPKNCNNLRDDGESDGHHDVAGSLEMVML